MSAVARKPDPQTSGIDLAPMRRRHIRQVMRIESLVYPRPWSSTLFLQEIARRSDRVYLVARADGEVIGYGGLMTSGLEAHITTIAVDPDHQRRHIGMRLMIGLMEAAMDRGGKTVTLEVRKSNLGAQAMYELFGFQPVGIRKGYYVETGEDAIVMWVDGIDRKDYERRLEELRERCGDES